MHNIHNTFNFLSILYFKKIPHGNVCVYVFINVYVFLDILLLLIIGYYDYILIQYIIYINCQYVVI